MTLSSLSSEVSLRRRQVRRRPFSLRHRRHPDDSPTSTLTLGPNPSLTLFRFRNTPQRSKSRILSSRTSAGADLGPVNITSGVIGTRRRPRGSRVGFPFSTVDYQSPVPRSQRSRDSTSRYTSTPSSTGRPVSDLRRRTRRVCPVFLPET